MPDYIGTMDLNRTSIGYLLEEKGKMILNEHPSNGTLHTKFYIPIINVQQDSYEDTLNCIGQACTVNETRGNTGLQS